MSEKVGVGGMNKEEQRGGVSERGEAKVRNIEVGVWGGGTFGS
jgi:hypothetical protein